MTDEVLTERKAGWHSGSWKPWRLRGRPEIALPLLHAALHHNWFHRHGCHSIIKPARNHGKGTTGCSTLDSHIQVINSGRSLTLSNTWCDLLYFQANSSRWMRMCTKTLRTTTNKAAFCLLHWKQGRMHLLTFHVAQQAPETHFSPTNITQFDIHGGGKKKKRSQRSSLTTLSKPHQSQKGMSWVSGGDQTPPVGSLTIKHTWQAFQLMSVRVQLW